MLIFCGCALLLNSQCSVTTCKASHVDIPRIAASSTSTTKDFMFLHSRPSYEQLISTVPLHAIPVPFYAVRMLSVGFRQSAQGVKTLSSCSGNMSLNVLNGIVFACAPVSTFSVKLCIPGLLQSCIIRVAYASFS